MFSQPPLTIQPKPQTNRNYVKKVIKAILILVFVVLIVILLTFAVILSGRTAISPMQTPSPAPTTFPTATRVSASSLILISVGFLQPCNPEMRLGLKAGAAKKGLIGGAHDITALPLNALQFNYLW